MTPLEAILGLLVVFLLLANAGARERAARAETNFVNALVDRDEQIRSIARDEIAKLITPKGRSDA